MHRAGLGPSQQINAFAPRGKTYGQRRKTETHAYYIQDEKKELQMSETIENLHNQVINYLKQGKFAEGIEGFYAENATAQENSNPPTVGRATMVTNENIFLSTVTAYHGIEILATGIDDQGNGNGVVLYEAVMQWDQKDKGHVTVNQAVVERWQNGKIAHIRFYGNFDPS